MARTSGGAATPQPADLSLDQIREALPRLERRLAALEKLDVTAISYGSDHEVSALDHAIKTTIGKIFGVNSLEYNKFKDIFWGISLFGEPGTPILRERLELMKAEGLALFRGQIELLKEQLGENGTGDPAGKAIRAYSNLDLHPEIARAASGLYQDGHYANAIEDAVKALNAYVRYRSGVQFDGATLMQTVFSPKTPVLRFNDLQDESDRNEQQGFMMMFAGAVAGLRNPRAHKLIKDDPERALEFIAFVSLLAKLLDGAKK